MLSLNTPEIHIITFRSLLTDPMAGALDAYFETHGWVLQQWITNGETLYQIYLGKGVQVDNCYEYAFPHLYEFEALRDFAEAFYNRNISSPV